MIIFTIDSSIDLIYEHFYNLWYRNCQKKMQKCLQDAV